MFAKAGGYILPQRGGLRAVSSAAVAAGCARVLGVTEVDVRSVEQHPTLYVYVVRLWNRRRLQVAAIDLWGAI